jgi:Lysyl oxidase
LTLRSVYLRRGFPLLALALFLLLAGSAYAADNLPDLEQQVPKQVQIGGGSGNWQIGFLSEVVNRGGNLEIHGHRASASGNMTADQVIYQTQGGTRTVAGVGDLHYETGFGHQHWHFEPFDHYEIRKLDGTLIGTDQKEGFCLGDNNNHGGGGAVYNDPSFCQQNNPGALSLTEGISHNWGDSYDPLKEGQFVPLSQSAEPAGEYNLVHRVNENSDGSQGPVQEASFGNNVASAHIKITWNSSGKPSVSVLKSCMGTASCGPVPPAPPAPPPPPPTTTTTPTSPPVVPNDILAPKLSFAKSTKEHFRAKSTAVFVFATCDEQCTLTAQGRILIGGAAKTLRTSKTRVTLPAGTKTRVVLTVSRSLRKKIRSALAHHRRVRVKINLTVVDLKGNKATIPRTLTLTR